MNEQQLHELIGRLTMQVEVLRLALVEAQTELAESGLAQNLPVPQGADQEPKAPDVMPPLTSPINPLGEI